MTVYKAIKHEAETAAEMAVALVKGEDVRHERHRHRPDRQRRACPSYIFTPVVVTKDNVDDTVIKDGFYDAPPTSARATTSTPARQPASADDPMTTSTMSATPDEGAAAALARHQQAVRRGAGADRRRPRRPRR